MNNRKLILVATLAVSLLGVFVFFVSAGITYDVHILFPVFTITAMIFYIFCYAWPFIGASIIEMNKRLVGTHLFEADAIAKVLFWLAIASLPVALLIILFGGAIVAIGISGNFGLIAGCCHYLTKDKK